MRCIKVFARTKSFLVNLIVCPIIFELEVYLQLGNGAPHYTEKRVKRPDSALTKVYMNTSLVGPKNVAKVVCVGKQYLPSNVRRVYDTIADVVLVLVIFSKT